MRTPALSEITEPLTVRLSSLHMMQSPVIRHVGASTGLWLCPRVCFWVRLFHRRPRRQANGFLYWASMAGLTRNADSTTRIAERANINAQCRGHESMGAPAEYIDAVRLLITTNGFIMRTAPSMLLRKKVFFVR